jgi:hypothetical protein
MRLSRSDLACLRPFNRWDGLSLRHYSNMYQRRPPENPSLTDSLLAAAANQEVAVDQSRGPEKYARIHLP